MTMNCKTYGWDFRAGRLRTCFATIHDLCWVREPVSRFKSIGGQTGIHIIGSKIPLHVGKRRKKETLHARLFDAPTDPPEKLNRGTPTRKSTPWDANTKHLLTLLKLRRKF